MRPRSLHHDIDRRRWVYGQANKPSPPWGGGEPFDDFYANCSDFTCRRRRYTRIGKTAAVAHSLPMTCPCQNSIEWKASHRNRKVSAMAPTVLLATTADTIRPRSISGVYAAKSRISDTVNATALATAKEGAMV